MQTSCPFYCRRAVVEGLPRYRLAHCNAEGLASLCEHLARQQCHLEVKLDAETFAPVGDAVETAAVAGLDMHRDEVALMLDGFLYHCGLPFEIDDFAFDTA